MKAISLKIIDFLAQIENFQKKLWEKKKFVIDTFYVITVGTIPEIFYDEIAKCEEQWKEWKELLHIDENQIGLFTFDANQINKRIAFLKSHPTLPLDTRHFPPDFVDRLLASFDDLDEMTDGLLVHSENWQALNMLQEKYRERVKCVYIDPPYNTGSDEFLYRDAYQHSSWLAMMENRLRLAKDTMRSDGSIFISNDDNEQAALKGCMDFVFGLDNFVTQIIWQKKFSPQNDAKYLSDNHDYLTLFARTKVYWRRNLLPRTDEVNARYENPDNDPRGPWMSSGLDVKTYAPEYDYPITTPSGRIVSPPRGACWRVSKERLKELISENRIWFGQDGNNVPRLKRFLSDVREGIVPLTIWSHKEVGHNQEAKQQLKAIMGDLGDVFQTPKPARLLQRCFQIGADSNSTILDYFAGSGTTGHAVINLNREDGGKRKFILVEMAQYFDTVLLPRIKKVTFTPEWKDGKPKRMATSEEAERSPRIIQVLGLEQYEDTLNNIEFIEGGTAPKTLMDFEGYFLRYMLDFETRESPCRMNVTKLERPFDYTLRIIRDSQLHNETVDLVETFNYLLGLKVKRIRTFNENGTPYRVVHGETLAGESTTIIWRTTTGLDLKKDKQFIEETILKDPKLKAEKVYINADFHVEGAFPIEPEFQRLMGA